MNSQIFGYLFNADSI